MSTPVLTQDKVDFLGLELSSYDAKVALYVIFACLLASFLVEIFAVYQVLRARKKLKEIGAELYKMDKM